MKLLAVVYRILSPDVRGVVWFVSLTVNFFILSLFEGLIRSYQSRVDATPAQVLVVSSAKRTFLPLSLSKELLKRSDISSVVHVAQFPGSRGERRFMVEAIGGAELLFETMGLEMKPSAEVSLRHSRTGVVIGEDLAYELGLKVGDSFIVRSPTVVRRADGTSEWSFQVASIYEAKKGLAADRFFVNYDYIDSALYAGGVVSYLYLNVAPGEEASSTARDIDQLSLNSSYPLTTVPLRAWLSLRNRPVGDVFLLAYVIAGLIVVLSLLVQTSVGSQRISNRLPSFAVLLCLGHTRWSIWRCVTMLLALQALISALMGFLLATMVFPTVGVFLFGQTILPWSVLLTVGGVAVAITVTGSLPAALMKQGGSLASLLSRI